MSIRSRIKQTLTGIDPEARNIVAKAERGHRLESQLDGLYGEITDLEQQESVLLKEGKIASTVRKPRIAGQLSRLRQDIRRKNTSAKMMQQQINVLATDSHNLKLSRQLKITDLPDAETLTENAVAAEQVLEQVEANSALADSLAMTCDGISDDEAKILAEFENPETSVEATDDPEPEPSVKKVVRQPQPEAEAI